MKLFLLLISLTLFLSSCSVNRCLITKNFLVDVDTVKPYNIVGEYCIIKSKSINSSDDSAIVRLHVFDRINGKLISDGVARFNNNENKVLITNGAAVKKLYHGVYTIGISSLNTMPLIMKNLKLKPYQIIDINCYLGSLLQY